MIAEKGWLLKGTFYECCIREGQCPLWLGRDLWEEPCTNFATYQVKQGQIQGVDVKGIVIIHHRNGIGPNFAEYVAKGVKEGAAYISNNATALQRKILEPFVRSHLGAERWGTCLGVKFVKVSITEEDGTYYVTMPFGEQKLRLTLGGDKKTPVGLVNPPNTGFSNVKLCNTDFWNYHDYGRNLEFHNTSGVIADFSFGGD